MKAKIVQFRRGRHTYKPRHFLLDVSAKNKQEAEKFIGKKVEWKSSSGKLIKGEIKASHGNRGCVRAALEKGLPGQALGQKIKIQ